MKNGNCKSQINSLLSLQNLVDKILVSFITNYEVITKPKIVERRSLKIQTTILFLLPIYPIPDFVLYFLHYLYIFSYIIELRNFCISYLKYKMKKISIKKTN